MSHAPEVFDVDVAILGGGPAGTAAAMAAGRLGVRTLLVERYGFLGGGGTVCGASSFDGLHAIVNGKIERVVRGIVNDVLSDIAALDGLNEPHLVQGKIFAQSYDVSAWKIVADNLVLNSGASIWFHSLAAGALMSGRRIDTIHVETRSGIRHLRAKCYVDCSGEGNLAAWAGAAYDKGDASGFLQPMSMLFRLAGVDDDAAQASLPAIPGLMQQANTSGEFNLPRIGNVLRPMRHPGEWRANLTKISREPYSVDGTDADDMTYAEIEGRRQVLAYWQFLRAHVPGFQRSYIVDVGPEVGVRETRRVRGGYVLSPEDIRASRAFEDGIGVSGWPVEKHGAQGVEWYFPEGRGYHDIPLRCLMPPAIENLLIAGRCISAEPDAQAAIRVSGPCFVTGQAAGTLAAMACRENALPIAIGAVRLRQELAAAGVFLGEN